MHLMLANLPGVSYERAEKIPGDKKHDPGLRGFSHRVVALRSSIQHTETSWLAAHCAKNSWTASLARQRKSDQIWRWA
jgi:hypothetical protein